MLHYSLFPTAIGDCAIAWREATVVATHLPEKTPETTATRFARRTGATLGEPTPIIRDAIESITTLLAGNRVDLTYIDCDFSGLDAFAVKVYSATRAIPAGETQTYGDIATQIGNKQLAQNVGRTLGRNPLPIIVPCHRVLGANNKLTGFSAYGGIDTKLKMLNIERARFSETPGLFDDLPLDPTPPE